MKKKNAPQAQEKKNRPKKGKKTGQGGWFIAPNVERGSIIIQSWWLKFLVGA